MKQLRALFMLAIFVVSPYSLGQSSCTLIPDSKTCVDTTPCKTSSDGSSVCLAGVTPPKGGLNVANTCWQFAYSYACDGASADSCTQYESNSACTVVSSQCMNTVPETGKCTSWNYTYKCQAQAASSTQQTVCSASGVTIPTNITAPANQNNHFAQAAVAMEIARQAQIYQKDFTIFNGVAETCTKGYYGIKNCCNASPGASSNSAVMTTALGQSLNVAKYAGEKAVDAASPYVFDAMFDSGLYSDGMVASLMSSSNVVLENGEQIVGTSFASSGLTLGAYGFTYGTGTFSAGYGAIEIADFGDLGFLSFNPYALIAAIIIMEVISLMDCTQAEQMLALHKGADLSYFIKEECSQKVPITNTCIKWTDTYCSFNSVLAKVINIQGKTQLGMDISNCNGLTISQVTQIDFTKIDFSEFTQQILNNVQLPQNVQGNYQSVMQGTSKGSSQGTSTLPSY